MLQEFFVVIHKLTFILHFSLSRTQKDEVYLNLVMDYVPENVYRVARHYSRAKQHLPMVYVKVTSFDKFPYENLFKGQVHRLNIL